MRAIAFRDQSETQSLAVDPEHVMRVANNLETPPGKQAVQRLG